MKKLLAGVIACSVMLSLAACGGSADNEPATSADAVSSAQMETSSEETETVPSVSSLEGLDAVRESMMQDVENTVDALEVQYNDLLTEINTYSLFLENTDNMDAFYENVLYETQQLCLRMREYSIQYVEAVLALNESNDEKYDDLDDLYDDIYDDAGDDIYDDIYDGLLDDAYDDFYDGLLDDAYDNEEYSSYSEWSEARSNEYKRWSDTRSDVYSEWSDFRSDVYGFWSDIRSALYRDDMEKAEKEIEDFREDIEKLRNKKTSGLENADTEESGQEEAASENLAEDSGSSTSSADLVDGMRPEFKEAMDSYEAFYDEYCDFMKEYQENPSDISLLADYSKMMEQLAEMDEKFEAWEDSDLNDAELKYYLKVQTSVSQKLLDAAL